MRKPKAWQATKRALPIFVVVILALALALPVLADGPPDQSGQGCKGQKGECPQTGQQDHTPSGKPENPGKAQQDHTPSGKPENPGKAQPQPGTQVLSEFRTTLVQTRVYRERRKPVDVAFYDIPYADSTVLITNSGGLKNLRITVNQQRFQVAGLKHGEIRAIDVSSAMMEGRNNTIVLTALGKPGTRAEVKIGN